MSDAPDSLPLPMPWARVRRIALPLAAVIWAVAVFWRAPMLRAAGQDYVVGPVTALPFALALAYGIAAVAVLAAVNWSRWRRVLRPNAGRVIGAVVLMGLTPLVIVDGLPFILGGAGIVRLLRLADLPPGRWVQLVQAMLGWGIGGALAWYPVSALIVSGVRARGMRFALFALMFWASYSAVALIAGAVHWRCC